MSDNHTPHSVEAEEAVIGSVLLNTRVLPEIAPMLQADDFYIVRHQWIWTGILSLHARREPIDFSTLPTELELTGKLAEIGGAAYLLSLVNATPTALHAKGYAATVARQAFRRRLIGALAHVAQQAHNQELDEEDIKQAARAEILKATTREDEPEFVDARAAASEAWDVIAGYISPERNPNYLDLGIPGLMETCDHDVTRSLYMVIAATTGVGKSALVTEVCRQLAMAGHWVLMATPEVPPGRVFARMAQGQVEWRDANGMMFSGVTKDMIRNRQDIQEAIMTVITDALPQLPIRFTRKRIISVDDIYADVQLLAYQGIHIEAVIVDSVQRLREVQNDRLDGTELAHAKLDGLAKDLNLLVIGTNEIRKGGEKLSRRPRIDDLSYGGHHKPDIVLGLYDEHYGKTGPEVPDKRALEVLPLKLRYGRTSDVHKVMFDRPTQRIW